MPPRFKFTREEITMAALNVTRGSGPDGLTARALAEALGCSVKPIFGLFRNMEEVQASVLEAARGLYEREVSEAMAAGTYPPYKASGMAYIRFAREERELFKLLFMADRKGEPPSPGREMEAILPVIMKNTGLSREQAELFHLEMWVFVHGIASMVATGYLDWDEEIVSRVLTDAYMGLKTRFCGEEGRHGSHPNG